MNRQNKMLLILALILAGALMYAYHWYPRQEFVTGDVESLRSQPQGSNVGGQSQSALAGLRLNFYQENRGEFRAPKRDIFSPLYVEKKIVRKPVKPAPKPKPVVKPKPVPKPKVVAAPPPVKQQPIANFVLLGYLDKDSERTVFLGLKDEIFIVKTGDLFAKEYRVAELTPDQLLIRRESDSREIRIELKKAGQ